MTTRIQSSQTQTDSLVARSVSISKSAAAATSAIDTSKRTVSATVQIHAINPDGGITITTKAGTVSNAKEIEITGDINVLKQSGLIDNGSSSVTIDSAATAKKQVEAQATTKQKVKDTQVTGADPAVIIIGLVILVGLVVFLYVKFEGQLSGLFSTGITAVAKFLSK